MWEGEDIYENYWYRRLSLWWDRTINVGGCVLYLKRCMLAFQNFINCRIYQINYCLLELLFFVCVYVRDGTNDFSFLDGFHLVLFVFFFYLCFSVFFQFTQMTETFSNLKTSSNLRTFFKFVNFFIIHQLFHKIPWTLFQIHELFLNPPTFFQISLTFIKSMNFFKVDEFF